jgi:putative RecB family exonuclease
VSELGVPVAVDQQASTLPATLSPSRASDYLSCQLKFFFTAVERWRTPPTEHTALGNLVHEVIEKLYLLDAPERTRATAGQLLDEAWTDWSVKPDYVVILNPQIRQKAELSLDGLFELEDPTSLVIDPEHVEAWVEATLYGAPIRGRIDRMSADGIWRFVEGDVA